MYEDQPTPLPVAEQIADQPVDRTEAETWCHWHGDFTDTGRLVTAVEQGSGPGAHQYACAPCRAQHHLTPWADQPQP
jgi:hypothetical protein